MLAIAFSTPAVSPAGSWARPRAPASRCRGSPPRWPTTTRCGRSGCRQRWSRDSVTTSVRTRIVGSMTTAASTPTGRETAPSSVSEAGPVRGPGPVPPHLAGRLERFRAALSGVDRLGVAFSGGVDSSVLLALASSLVRRDIV